MRLFKKAKSNTKEILESIILQEGLTDLIRNNAGKIATAGVLGAGVAAGHALGGGDFSFGGDDAPKSPNQETKVTTANDAVNAAEEKYKQGNIKQVTIDGNERPGFWKTVTGFMDQKASADQYQRVKEKADELRSEIDNKNPDWFTTGEKLGAGAIGAGLIGGGLLAAKARSRGKR